MDIALGESPKHGKKASGIGNDKLTKYTWVADSGASCHMVNDASDMFDVPRINESIKFGDGKLLRSTQIGKIRRTVRHKDGSTLKVTLEAKYVPDLWVNLFSLTRAMMGGGQLGNKGLVITMSKNNKTIKFDKIFNTKNGYVGGVDICPTQQSQNVGTFRWTRATKFV